MTSTSEIAPPPDPTLKSQSPSRTWCGFRAQELLALFISIVTVAVVTFPKLPQGICFDDAGDFQLSASTLGIAHPPGYPNYVTLAWPFTWTPIIEPAYAISICCMVVGLVALTLAWALQVSLGVNAWVAGAVVLGLSAHRRVWMNISTPEVYIFSIAFCLAAVYLLQRYSVSRRTGLAVVAAMCLGTAIISRPPIVLCVPFFLVGFWFADRSQGRTFRESARTLALCVLAAIVPVIYSAGYILVRDRPTTPHNFLEDQNRESQELPESSAGVGARLERLYWEASAKMFRRYLGDSLNGVRAKFHWARASIALESPWATWVMGILAAAGLVIGMRRSPAAALSLLGIALSAFGYVLVYRIHGQAADLLPVIMACGIAVGWASCMMMPREVKGIRNNLAIIVLVGTVAWTFWDSPERPHGEQARGAGAFLHEARVNELPEGAVLCANWRTSIPLKYGALILHKRSDMIVFAADPKNFFKVTEGLKDRPIFVEGPHPLIDHCELIPYGGLWKWMRAKCSEKTQD